MDPSFQPQIRGECQGADGATGSGRSGVTQPLPAAANRTHTVLLTICGWLTTSSDLLSRPDKGRTQSAHPSCLGRKLRTVSERKIRLPGLARGPRRVHPRVGGQRQEQPSTLLAAGALRLDGVSMTSLIKETDRSPRHVRCFGRRAAYEVRGRSAAGSGSCPRGSRQGQPSVPRSLASHRPTLRASRSAVPEAGATQPANEQTESTNGSARRRGPEGPSMMIWVGVEAGAVLPSSVKRSISNGSEFDVRGSGPSWMPK